MIQQFNEREVLDNPSKVSHKVAESFALSEFEKYRVIQDKLFTYVKLFLIIKVLFMSKIEKWYIEKLNYEECDRYV